MTNHKQFPMNEIINIGYELVWVLGFRYYLLFGAWNLGFDLVRGQKAGGLDSLDH